MSRLGDFRLNTYELLFREPLIKYCKNNSLKILILGDTVYAAESLKAVLWAGQSEDTSLSVTIAIDPDDIEDFTDSIYSAMPHLKTFCDEYNISINIVPPYIKSMVNALAEPDSWYDYILLCQQDFEDNYSTADSLVNYVNNHFRSASDSDITNMIAVLNDDSPSETRRLLNTDKKSSRSRIIPYGTTMDTQPECEKNKLIRYAVNINFAYDRKDNQNHSYADSKAAFDAQFEEQFSAEPICDSPDSPASYFLGRNYSVDSSLASAVHMPYKMAYIAQFKGVSEAAAESALIEAIDQNNDLYDRLCIIEHKRWYAYMVARGYRPHKDLEELQELVLATNSNKNHADRIHICMVPADKGPSLSRLPDNEYDALSKTHFKIFNNEDSSFSMLDKVSLAHYVCINIKATHTPYRIPIEEYINRFSFLHQFEYLSECLKNMSSLPGTGSLNAYTSELNSLKSLYEESPDVISKLKELDSDSHMQLLKTRCIKTDFIAIDGQLIDMMPFVVWYGEKYGTVVTITNGNLAEDIIIPTVLTAKTAIFAGKHAADPEYMKRARMHFIKRGSNTEPVFINIKTDTIESLKASLSEIIGDYRNKDIVFNLVKHSNSEVPLCLGLFADRFPIVKYHPKKGIVNFMTNTPFCSGLDNCTLSVRDYMQLCGSGTPDVNKTDIPEIMYKFLKSLFWEKAHAENSWTTLSKMFVGTAKNSFLPLALRVPKKKTKSVLKGDFLVHTLAYYGSGLANVLSSLEAYKIIRNFSTEQAGEPGYLRITFDALDRNLLDFLGEFDRDNASSEEELAKKAKHTIYTFDILNGIRENSLYVENLEYASSNTKPNLKNDLEELLKALYAHKAISELSFSQKTEKNITHYYVSFRYASKDIKELLTKEGNLFEYIVFREFRNLGNYHDIKTGVAFKWEDDQINPLDIQRLVHQTAAESPLGIISYYDYRHIVNTQETNIPSTPDVRNEIDVIAMEGMLPVFVSCKVRSGLSEAKEWLYEINTVSDQFNAKAFLALHYNTIEKADKLKLISNRAKALEVELIGAEKLQ